MKLLYPLLFTFLIFGFSKTGTAQDSPTDCIIDAPDLTTFIATGITPAEGHGWTCGTNTTVLNAPLSASPATLTLTGDDSRNCDRFTTAPLDAWYKFTAGGTTEAWLTFYEGDSETDTSIGLYKTITAPSGACGTATGELELVDCSDAGAGGDRDVAECTMFEDRIDISGLDAGVVYYIRMWEHSGAVAPTAPIDFFLCAEQNVPVAPAVDKCEDLPHITPVSHIGSSTGCANDPAEGRDYTIKYTNQSNVGGTGRNPTGFVDNNAAAPTCLETAKYTGNGMVSTTNSIGDVDYDCDGGTTIALGGNTVLNANVMYSVFFEACDATATDVVVTFDNMTVTPPGESIQVNVLGPLTGSTDDNECSNNSTHVVALGVDPLVNPCVRFSNPANTIDGTFIIYVEGSNGALVKFDMEIDVDYRNCTSDPAPCDAVKGGGTLDSADDGLALEWGAFEGRAEDQYNIVEWITLSEVNNEYFEILRSVDGQQFQKIDHINGHGTTKEMKSYIYVDSKPLPDAYYQLRTVDSEGKETYSGIIRINRQKDILDLNSVYPIPTQDKVRVDFTAKNAGTAQFLITDMYGKVIQQLPVATASGSNTKTLNLDDYAAGIYYLTIEHDGTRVVKRMVKK